MNIKDYMKTLFNTTRDKTILDNINFNINENNLYINYNKNIKPLVIKYIIPTLRKKTYFNIIDN